MSGIFLLLKKSNFWANYGCEPKFLLFLSYRTLKKMAQSIAVNLCFCLSLYFAPSILLTKITPKFFSSSTTNWSQRAKSLLFLHNTSLTHISSKLIVIFQIIPYRFSIITLGNIFCPLSFSFHIFIFICHTKILALLGLSLGVYLTKILPF